MSSERQFRGQHHAEPDRRQQSATRAPGPSIWTTACCVHPHRLPVSERRSRSAPIFCANTPVVLTSIVSALEQLQDHPDAGKTLTPPGILQASKSAHPGLKQILRKRRRCALSSRQASSRRISWYLSYPFYTRFRKHHPSFVSRVKISEFCINRCKLISNSSCPPRLHSKPQHYWQANLNDSQAIKMP